MSFSRSVHILIWTHCDLHTREVVRSWEGPLWEVPLYFIWDSWRCTVFIASTCTHNYSWLYNYKLDQWHWKEARL